MQLDVDIIRITFSDLATLPPEPEDIIWLYSQVE